MNFNTFTISGDGSQSYYISLPCFCDDEHFDAAKRMNQFYSKISDKLYCDAVNILGGQKRRTRYICITKVIFENNLCCVLLDVQLKIPGEKNGRRTVKHKWRDGYIIELKSDIIL